MDQMNKLTLISTDELIDELMARYDHAIFAGCKDYGNNKSQLTWERHGMYFAQVGLVDFLCRRLREKEPRNDLE